MAAMKTTLDHIDKKNLLKSGLDRLDLSSSVMNELALGKTDTPSFI